MLLLFILWALHGPGQRGTPLTVPLPGFPRERARPGQVETLLERQRISHLRSPLLVSLSLLFYDSLRALPSAVHPSKSFSARSLALISVPRLVGVRL